MVLVFANLRGSLNLNAVSWKFSTKHRKKGKKQKNDS